MAEETVASDGDQTLTEGHSQEQLMAAMTPIQRLRYQEHQVCSSIIEKA